MDHTHTAAAAPLHTDLAVFQPQFLESLQNGFGVATWLTRLARTAVKISNIAVLVNTCSHTGGGIVALGASQAHVAVSGKHQRTRHGNIGIPHNTAMTAEVTHIIGGRKQNAVHADFLHLCGQTGNTLLVLRQRTFQKHTLSHNKIPLSYLARAALSTRAAR